VLANAALGISGEGGEVADLIKKHLFQGHDLPIDKMANELGDLLWYINLMADCIGFDLEQIAEMNIDKLYSRYKDGVFTEQQSINRKND